MQRSLSFYECEHEGDYENYAHDLKECGATIISHLIDTDAEIVDVVIEVEDNEKFMEQFRKTESYEFVD